MVCASFRALLGADLPRYLRPCGSGAPNPGVPGAKALTKELAEDILGPNNKAKKKPKAEEIVRLSKLSLDSIMEEAKDPKDVLFEPFLPGNSREPEVNIPTILIYQVHWLFFNCLSHLRCILQ